MSGSSTGEYFANEPQSHKEYRESAYQWRDLSRQADRSFLCDLRDSVVNPFERSQNRKDTPAVSPWTQKSVALGMPVNWSPARATLLQ